MTAMDGYVALGIDREYDLTADALLRAMDAAGVAQALIAPIDRCLAVLNREGNRALQQAASAHPERLLPACAANPWYGDAAVEELRRALGEGARMLILHPSVQGFLANDELVFPLLDAAAAAGIPVYVHTGPPGQATPWQVVDLAERYPTLDFVMGHCGATDFWNDVIEAARAAENVCLESSFARPFAFSRYADALGAHRCLVGSFAPLNDLVFEWEQMRLVLPPDDWPDVYGPTLQRLLEKRR